MKRLSLLDTGFLLAEKRETPMHVAGLHLLTLPKNADEHTFLHDLAKGLRSSGEFQPPFGDRLKMGALGLFGPVHWEPDESLDIDYHIRHSALPKPGRYRELFALVSRLHSQLLDRNRPLWEIQLIEGLQNRQFAVYMKFHHAAIDGVRSIHLTRSMYSTDARERTGFSPLSLKAAARYRAMLNKNLAGKVEPPTERELRNVAEMLKSGFDSSANVLGALKQVAGALTNSDSALTLPWRNVPRSPINTKVDGARRFVAQSWPFTRIRAVSKALDGTFNDTILAMCSGALRGYLGDAHALPKASLKAMVPISLRKPGDLESANAVGAISADLATNLRDPVRRFRAIQASMQAGKKMFEELSASEAQLVMQLMQFPGLLLGGLGLISRFPPYSTVISNVPGPREPLFWNGARLEGIYPASIVFDGFALNITLVTYADQVDFGITACRRSLPQVQRLIDHLEYALVELEEAAGIAATPKKRAARKKAPLKKAGRKTAVKKKAAKKTTSPARKTARKKSGKAKTTVTKSAQKKSAKAKSPAKKVSRKKTAKGNPPDKKSTRKKTATKKKK